MIPNRKPCLAKEEVRMAFGASGLGSKPGFRVWDIGHRILEHACVAYSCRAEPFQPLSKNGVAMGCFNLKLNTKMCKAV